MTPRISSEPLRREMKYCKKCILPETYPGISFNDEGICNFCLDYQPYHKYLGKEKLRDDLNSKERTGQYDCVVPISGGKDSSYILYYVVKELGLNPIAVTYDSGFQDEISKENARNACDILGVTLLVIKPPIKNQVKLLKESLLVSEKLGCFWYQCINCEAIIRTMSINTARAYGAPNVVWGSSALESVDKNQYQSYKSLGKGGGGILNYLVNPIIKRVNNLLKSPRKIKKLPNVIYEYIGYHVIKFNLLSISQRIALKFPYRFALRPHIVPPFTNENPKFVHFFDYITWDSIRNVKLLEGELDWRHPVEKDSRFDCKIHCLPNYQFYKSHGISHDGANLCNFIRENKLDREEAMKREQSFAKSIKSECKVLIESVGLKNYKLP